MRTLLTPLLRLVLRIFFRRIEVTGAERVPRAGPVIFVLNHPNGLIDPAFLLCLAPRRVSFLAKAPLFSMPVIGAIARAFEAIPVHRRQDAGSDLAKNAQTFETARAVLVRGGTIAIFPEGTSHSDPKLRPLKTGTARIALGAAAALPQALALEIVPAGNVPQRRAAPFRRSVPGGANCDTDGRRAASGAGATTHRAARERAACRDARS